MRKLKLQVQITVDGFVAGPNGEMDWMTWEWDNELKASTSALNHSMDTILLGRGMTDGFVSYWKTVSDDPENPEHDFGKLMTDTPKVVFTKTLTESVWDNTVIATGDITEEVSKLKAQPGKGIIVFGGATFVSSLIKHNLIDEYHLFVNPVVIGAGLNIFKELDSQRKLKLESATPFFCGIVKMVYTVA